jgi:hypothetical protein
VPDPSNDFRVSPAPPCRGCGGPAHGSVGVRIRCLEAAVEQKCGPLAQALQQAIQRVTDLEAELRPVRKLRAEVQAVNARFPSSVGRRGR